MAIGDQFGGPGTEIRAITPSDTTDLTGCRGFFYTGSTANVAVRTIHGASASAAVTITSCPAGVILPIQVTRIMSTNTTATQIYGIF